jgi:hypothetical protein
MSPVSGRFIVALRILLLLLAAGAVTAAVLIGVQRPDGAEPGVLYVCPMHPDVRAPSPGQCPICRMALEGVARDPAVRSTRGSQTPGMADTTAVDNVRKHRIIDVVRKRSLLFDARELRGPAWVENDGAIAAVFYNDQIAAIAPGERGSFSLTQAPEVAFAVRRMADAAVPWDRSTSRIRFRPDAVRPARAPSPLRPGQVGWLELPRKTREVLAVPVSAIVQSPEGPYVLAAVGPYSFEKRPIEIGETFLKHGFAVVLSGLRVHERVVSRATFFLDADRRLGMQAGDEEWVAR